MSSEVRYWTAACPVVLAPMSGVTDRPFRRLARRFGATMVVTEMVASERYAAGHAEEALRSAEDTAGEPYVMQLAGCSAAWMREAAVKAEAEGAGVIDINMGCPSKRVVGGYSGSALMRDLDIAAGLIAAVTSAVSVPVTVKMRLGWNHDSLNAPELARRAEALGVQAIAVHGRTRCQFYTGTADWGLVAATVRAVAIPVLVNGDIVDSGTAADALRRSGASGVMIGRATLGRPWLLGEVAAALSGCGWIEPSPATRRDAVLEQFDGSLDAYGPRLGLLNFRKHLAAYLAHEGLPRASVSTICMLTGPSAIREAIHRSFEDVPLRNAA